jgi:putative chitinase
MITVETLNKCIPLASATNIERFLKPINDTLKKYAINTPLRIAAFIAQVAHESGSLRYVRELATGEAYDIGKKALSLGNTPEDDGDGERYKGRGLIQITGRTNYEALGKALQYDFITHPEHLELPGAAAMSAGWFWNSRNLNQYADLGTDEAFLTISKKINGVNRATGLPNGWDDRLHRYITCKNALGI